MSRKKTLKMPRTLKRPYQWLDRDLDLCDIPIKGFCHLHLHYKIIHVQRISVCEIYKYVKWLKEKNSRYKAQLIGLTQKIIQ